MYAYVMSYIFLWNTYTYDLYMYYVSVKMSSFSYWGVSFKAQKHHHIDLSIPHWSQLSKLSELMDGQMQSFSEQSTFASVNNCLDPHISFSNLKDSAEVYSSTLSPSWSNLLHRLSFSSLLILSWEMRFSFSSGWELLQQDNHQLFPGSKAKAYRTISTYLLIDFNKWLCPTHLKFS